MTDQVQLAAELKSLTQTQLVALRDRMLSETWSQDLTPEQQKVAAEQLVRVQSAIRKLRVAKLAEIRGKLEGCEAELRAAQQEVAAKIQSLKATAAALDTIAAFLAVVSRVVMLA